MNLTDHEKAMYDGRAHGRAKARAMDLLVRYGEALGAERLVETNNVAGAFSPPRPRPRCRRLLEKRHGTRLFRTQPR